MSDTPLVSVIVCVYNAGEYLRPAVQSVLDQTYRNLEILIIDDGSTDGSMNTIADLLDPRIRVIRQENRGKPTAMNRALEEMRGEFYAIQDADDLSYPSRIACQVRAMQQHPQVAAVYSGHELILGDLRVAPTFQSKSAEMCSRDVQEYRMTAHDPTGIYRMNMVAGLRYAEDLPIVEGLDYMLRVGERWPTMVLGECLYSYRIHGESLTRANPERRDKLIAEALRRACVRRGEDFAARFPPAARVNGSPNTARDNGIAAHFMESACDLKQVRRRLEALKVGFHCARLHPLDFHYHKALIYALTPSWFVTSSRRPTA